MPYKTSFKRGKQSSDSCIESTVAMEDSNCIILENFDFKFDANGNTEGNFSKRIELYFTEKEQLNKIRSLFYSDYFQKKDTYIIEIIDTNPLSKENREETVWIRFQVPEKIPALSNSTQYKEKKLVPFKEIENSTIEPTRNQIKKESYIKHLLSFYNLLSRIEYFTKKQ